jgi:hypothetical protein
MFATRSLDIGDRAKQRNESKRSKLKACNRGFEAHGPDTRAAVSAGDRNLITKA